MGKRGSTARGRKTPTKRQREAEAAAEAEAERAAAEEAAGAGAGAGGEDADSEGEALDLLGPGAAAAAAEPEAEPEPEEPGARAAAPGEADTLKVLVVTDTHLGYKEDDDVRGEDSFRAFEEALQAAQRVGADLVLHGGDLFHLNKPTRKTVVKTLALLRRYCLGDRPIRFSHLKFNAGDGADFAPNWEDPNLNVGLPLYALHGNHDDPSGAEHLSAMDVVQASGLVNYFGKSKTVTQSRGANKGEGVIRIKPLLLQKGRTKVALYGLGWINDARCARMFAAEGQVQWVRPVEPEEGAPFFNLFAVHQNRNYAGQKNYLVEELLPQFLDLVLWGHEHESIPRAANVRANKFKVLQAGSTVATGLKEEEAKPKHCFVLQVKGENWKLDPVPLRTVRPLVHDKLVWRRHCVSEEQQRDFRVAVTAKVEDMIDEATRRLPLGQEGVKPLIHLVVQQEKGAPVSAAQLTQQFVGRVANPADMISISVKRAKVDKAAGAKSAEQAQGERSKHMHDLIESHLPELQLLQEDHMRTALDHFVRGDKKALETYVNAELEV